MISRRYTTGTILTLSIMNNEKKKKKKKERERENVISKYISVE